MIALLAAFLVAAAPSDTVPRDTLLTQRRKATELSDWYQVRLTVHKVGAFAELPLFAAQYVVGQRLYSGTQRNRSLSDVHAALAGTMGVLFASNTITGAWNLWDSRAEPKGRTRRIIHSVIMAASDAGFMATAALAEGDHGEGGGRYVGGSNNVTHRRVAIASMGLSAVGTIMMWIWRD